MMAFADDAPIHLLSKKSASAPRKKSGEWAKIGRRKFFMRSSWEVRFANYLEALKSGGAIKSWKYESKTFWFLKIKRGVRSYKPDFKVIFKDGGVIWYEVKGFMDKRSATKLKRMKKYYPKENVQVIGSEWFGRN